MAATNPPKGVAVRAYGAALHLLPAPDRREYGDAMLETFALRHAALRAGPRRALLLLRELGGLLRLWWRSHRGGTAQRRGETRASGRGPGRGRDGGHPIGAPSGDSRHRPGPVGRAAAWLGELRHAVRRLLRAPGFSLATVLTLAVAAGGNAAIFSVVHAILLQPLPYPTADRLVAVRSASPPAGADDMEMTIGLFLHYQERVDAFASIALYERAYRNLTADGEPTRLETIRATGDFFTALGVEATLGRTLGVADTAADAAPVVVLSDALWRTRYGADPGVIGRTVVMDHRPYTVVGVMPRGFAFPRPGTDAWTAWWIDVDSLPFMSFSYDAIARLGDGATLERVNAEIARAVASYPEAFGWEQDEWDRLGLIGFVRPLREHLIGGVGSTLWLFAGAGLFVMLLACANVANLFLVRAETRLAEARIRSALGASRPQLLRFWTAEALCIAVLAALLGLAVAAAGLGSIVRLAPDLPRIESVRLSGVTILFTALLAAIAAIVLGSAPLLFGSGDAGPLNRRGATASLGARRGRELLVGVQVALAVTLTVGAALMLQSVRNLLIADPGFDPRGVLTFNLSLQQSEYPDREAAARFHQQLIDALAALPMVHDAGLARCLPLQGWCGGNPIASPDSPLPVEAFRQVASVKPVSAGYLETVRVPLLAGRTLVPDDQTRRTGAAIVSEALAQRLFPGDTPAEVLGKRLYPQGDLDADEWFTVVGVVASVQRSRIDEPPAEMLYVPLLGVAGDRHLAPVHDVTVAVRVDGDPLAAVDPVREVVRTLDADLPIARIRSLADIHAAASARQRFTGLLLTLAAATGLLLGAIGIYGVVSWSTRQRTVEFGVRAALGARRVDLLTMVMTRALFVIGVGIVLGLLASRAAGGLLGAMLYEIHAGDPLTFVLITALLLAIGAVATWLPARRAASIDPVEALRGR